jgi:nucleoside-diphosphate-sugar epimerase
METRVLLTGHNGYIGSVMAPLLAHAGYGVVGVDTGYFDACTLVPDKVRVPAMRKDIRDLTAADLEGFDAVIHLAALSNDPIGNLDADWTREINYEGTARLAQSAKAAGVERFLFSSSCIMYGMSEANVVDESSPLDPRTEYARSKVRAEEAVRKLAGGGFSPTFLRNGTIYGLSPRMRFDTVLNDLVGTAIATGEVVVHSDGKPWRPVVHVEDVARAFLTILAAPVETVHNQAFNIGANHLNHQIRELAEIVARAVAGCKLEMRPQSGADQRTYKADFSKFARTFPTFEFHWTAETGAQELARQFRSLGLSREDLVDKRYTRLQWLRYLLDSEKLAGALRWNGVAEETIYAGAEQSL